MPAAKKHKAQAEHNQELALKLSSENAFLDWAYTACFYSCVHYLQCYFYKKCGSAPQTHNDRDQWAAKSLQGRSLNPRQSYVNTESRSSG